MYFPSVLWLMVIDCLSGFLFGFEYLSVLVGGKFSVLSTSFSLIYSPISPFLIFYLFPVLCPLFLTCVHHVSVGPPIWKGTLLMLYYI